MSRKIVSVLLPCLALFFLTTCQEVVTPPVPVNGIQGQFPGLSGNAVFNVQYDKTTSRAVERGNDSPVEGKIQDGDAVITLKGVIVDNFMFFLTSALYENKRIYFLSGELNDDGTVNPAKSLARALYLDDDTGEWAEKEGAITPASVAIDAPAKQSGGLPAKWLGKWDSYAVGGTPINWESDYYDRGFGYVTPYAFMSIMIRYAGGNPDINPDCVILVDVQPSDDGYLALFITGGGSYLKVLYKEERADGKPCLNMYYAGVLTDSSVSKTTLEASADLKPFKTGVNQIFNNDDYAGHVFAEDTSDPTRGDIYRVFYDSLADIESESGTFVPFGKPAYTFTR
jgi:hypothetical protein